jgi:hypothetical protein
MSKIVAASDIHYRSFGNLDPPKLVAVWQSRRDQPGFCPAVTVETFEQFVLANRTSTPRA